MAGGSRLITVPSGRSAMACCTRSASSLEVAPSRWSQSLSMVKAMAALVPEPEKLKPRITRLEASAGRVATCRSNALTTASVRSLVASVGNWIEVMK
ncbi:hypothetical protein NB706_002907 [Xanthomonas sacchari]|nr:hypothetical protein [Xanthomonas sacchari]